MAIWIFLYSTRGAWQGQAGAAAGDQPNSLLRNNGDGTFTDVTIEAGLLSFNPTQTATWNDFNNDGWLDLFIGNETVSANSVRLCEFYINNHDGTFKNVASEWDVKVGALCQRSGFRRLRQRRLARPLFSRLWMGKNCCCATKGLSGTN